MPPAQTKVPTPDPQNLNILPLRSERGILWCCPRSLPQAKLSKYIMVKNSSQYNLGQQQHRSPPLSQAEQKKENMPCTVAKLESSVSREKYQKDGLHTGETLVPKNKHCLRLQSSIIKSQSQSQKPPLGMPQACHRQRGGAMPPAQNPLG